MNFSIEGIDNVVDKLTQYASGDKIQRGLAMAGRKNARSGKLSCCNRTFKGQYRKPSGR